MGPGALDSKTGDLSPLPSCEEVCLLELLFHRFMKGTSET